MKHVSRRTWLRGAGAAMSLPWLESISAGAPVKGTMSLPEPPLRSVFLFMPNGVRPDYWTPEGDGEDYAITPHLKPLEHLKSEFLLLENLWNKNSVGRNGHWPKVPAFLSGGWVERTTGGDLDAGGVTVDQYAAQRVGFHTPLPSLELGIDAPRTGIDTAGGGFPRALGSFLSWADSKTPVPKEIVPQAAFDRLFRSQKPRSVEAATDETSILDLVRDQAQSLRRNSSRGDQARLDEYFESVRAVERRIELSTKPQKRWINEGTLGIQRPAEGIPSTHTEHVQLMLDILLLSLWTDTTRIATFMFGDAQSSQDYSFLPGVKGSFHGLSHHRDMEHQRKQYETIVTWHMTQLARFLDKVRTLKEGGSSLLDNSMIFFGGTLKCGNRHDPENLPILLAGRGKGKIRPGRRVRADVKTPLCNLYLAMLHNMGIEAESFGDSTKPLSGLS